MQSYQVPSSPRTKRSVSMDRSVFPAPFATLESAQALRSYRCTSLEWLERPYSWKVSKMAAKMAKQDAKVTQCQRSATEPISEKSDISKDNKITTVAFDLPSGPHNLNVPRIVLTAADAKEEVRATAHQTLFSKAEQQMYLNIREQYYDMRYIPRRRRDSLDGLSYVTCPRTTKPKPTPLRQRLLMWIPEHCSLKKRDGSRDNLKGSGVQHDSKL
ncbi:hypothetical protein LTS10_002423 [Elasticomyces elasticus]|nr:hypothetical protein LTS10_002423 [Elasticomyces elasticus]